MSSLKAPERTCIFLGSSRKDLIGFPEPVRAEVGYALHEAQQGLGSYRAKALQGFDGRGILEIIENHDGNTYRAVYAARFAGFIYILHCFQKKSVKGISTSQKDIGLIKSRLKLAEADFLARKGTAIA